MSLQATPSPTSASLDEGAVRHFASKLRYETDPSDVAAARATGEALVLVDVRSADGTASLTPRQHWHGTRTSVTYRTCGEQAYPSFLVTSWNRATPTAHQQAIAVTSSSSRSSAQELPTQAATQTAPRARPS